jgi:hypothetical protein
MNDVEGPNRSEMERLYHTMDDGFRGVHSRLDQLNGRTLKGEIADAELRARIMIVENELAGHPNRRTTDREQAARRLSGKDMALGGIGLTLLAGAIKLLLVIGEFGLEMMKTAVKH